MDSDVEFEDGNFSCHDGANIKILEAKFGRPDGAGKCNINPNGFIPCTES